VCGNSRGIHGAGDQRCLVRERQVEVARIRVMQVSYAEALKRVVEEDEPPLRKKIAVKVQYNGSIKSNQIVLVTDAWLADVIVSVAKCLCF
jgi:hypothetical protein